MRKIIWSIALGVSLSVTIFMLQLFLPDKMFGMKPVEIITLVITLLGIIIVPILKYYQDLRKRKREEEKMLPPPPEKKPERLKVLLKSKWFKTFVFFMIMLVGMLAREAYNMLVKGKPFNLIGFFVGAVVSPMIFSSVYADIRTLDIDVTSLTLSFQSGFFWSSVFEVIGPD